MKPEFEMPRDLLGQLIKHSVKTQGVYTTCSMLIDFRIACPIGTRWEPSRVMAIAACEEASRRFLVVQSISYEDNQL